MLRFEVSRKWDFIEAPSKMLESWVLEDEVLGQFARHYVTGEVMSQTLMARLRESQVSMARVNPF